VPKFIGNFTSLRTLDLSNNNLTQWNQCPFEFDLFGSKQ
jgi:Leucine-rich repeat (LRR) protein